MIKSRLWKPSIILGVLLISLFFGYVHAQAAIVTPNLTCSNAHVNPVILQNDYEGITWKGAYVQYSSATLYLPKKEGRGWDSFEITFLEGDWVYNWAYKPIIEGSDADPREDVKYYNADYSYVWTGFWKADLELGFHNGGWLILESRDQKCKTPVNTFFVVDKKVNIRKPIP